MMVGLLIMVCDIDFLWELYFWLFLVFGLICGLMFLMVGLIVDVVGVCCVEFMGCFVFGGFILVCGVVEMGV